MALSFFIKFKKEYKKVNYADICYIEAKRNYIKIVTAAGNHLCLNTMVQVESILPKDEFCRVHRSYIVRMEYISSFEREKIYVHGKCLPVGDHYWKGLLQRLTVLNCSSDELVKLEDGSLAMTA